MATSIEAQGHTVDEAIQIALNQLGVSRDKVEIDILHHPRRGLLGIGARRAKVRATIRASVMLDGEEFDMSGGESLDEKPRRRRRRGGRNRGRGDDRPEGGPEAPRPAREQSRGQAPRADAGGPHADTAGQRADAAGPRTDAEGRRSEGDQSRGRGESGRGRDDRRGSRGGRQERRGERGPENRENRDNRGQQPARSPGGTEQRDARQDQPRDQRGQKQPGREGERRENDRRDRGRDRQGRGRGEGDATSAPRRNEERPTEASEETTAHPEQAYAENRRAHAVEEAPPDAEALEAIRARAEQAVRELLSKMGFAAEVTSSVDVEAAEAIVSVRSESEGLLIGRRGQTLDSLEHIVNRMVLRGDAYVEGRILLDIGDYRGRRRASLEELAGRLRARAVGEHRTVQVSPMSPRDRKFFAEVFANDEAVEIRALGAGFYRRVIVAPAGSGAAAVAAVHPGDDVDADGGSDDLSGAEADS